MKALAGMSKNLSGDSIFRHFLVPLAALVMYFGAFAWVSAHFFAGVNAVFTARMTKYLLILFALGCGLALVTMRKRRLPLDRFRVQLRWGDLALVLLPLTTLVQYIFKNRAMILPQDMFFTLLFFGLFAAVLIVLFPALLAFAGNRRVLTAVGLAFMLTIVNMAMLSQQYHWFEAGALKIQVAYLGVMLALAWLLAGVSSQKMLWLLAAVYLSANLGAQLFSQAKPAGSSQPPVTTAASFSAIVGGRKPQPARNVYFLVYDAYVANETMRAHGIDNQAQETYLQSMGFVLYPHTYSVGPSTLTSMSRVLNVSVEDGGINAEAIKKEAVSGSGVVQSLFHDLGYKTYGVFATNYNFRGIGSSYDVSVPEGEVGPSALLINAVLMGEFRFNVGFDTQSYDEFLSKKLQILEDVAGAPRFVYAHSSRPSHSQNSGACLANEPQLFAQRLTEANNEMRQDVATLVQHDPQAVIIIAGDHGPHLTKNCTRTGGAYAMAKITRLDIQDRFGSFLAIRWPDGDFAAYDEITVLQDVFPAVLAYLYRDPAFFELRIAPETLDNDAISGVRVINGVIMGGADDGEALFLSGE